MNRYLSIMLLAVLSGVVELQPVKGQTRLVVNITVDQFSNEQLEQFSYLYGQEGLRRLLEQGLVYEQGEYGFKPVDRSSAVASITTGTTPYYNGIPGDTWIRRENLSHVISVKDEHGQISPRRIAVSTIGDELKLQTSGKALVYSVAPDADAAVLGGGHAANAAFWLKDNASGWTTSRFYNEAANKWIATFNSLYGSKDKGTTNDKVMALAVQCVKGNMMGRDDVPDYLSVMFSALKPFAGDVLSTAEQVYMNLDRNIGSLISQIEQTVGKDKVLFVLTSTGYNSENSVDYGTYGIPSGTFYINRTANLLNMYLGAVYGQGKYVDMCFNNQIYLNRELIDHKNLSFDEVRLKSIEFLIQNAGVSAANPSPYRPDISGDIVIEVNPGWNLVNEDTHETFTSRLSALSFPIIFYGRGVRHELVSEPVSTERIAPTICKSIHIRAPNACKHTPLF